MSKLKELIQKLCPNGVEFKKLGDVCNFINGFAFKSSLFKERGEIIIRITNINGTSIELDDVKYFNLSDYNTDLQSFIVRYGDILIAMSGATTGKVGCYYYKNKAYLNQRVGKFVPNKKKLNNRYLFHFLCSITTELYVMAGGGAQPNLSSTKLMNNVVIPLPPLDVQNEIVRILDTFTSHTAELQAELQARKEQYEYYRNKLLTFDKDDKNVKWMKLGDIGTFIRGNGLQKKDFTECGVGCIHYGQIYTYYGTSANKTKSFVAHELANKLVKVKTGNLIIACTSENIEDVCKAVAWLGKEDIVIGGHSCVFVHNENPKYISYFFQTDFFSQQKRKYARGAKVIDIKTSDLEKIIIPILPHTEQQRIVSILDKFEALVNDLTEGIPAEIAAVQEQYEYYRNKLLTFKQK